MAMIAGLSYTSARDIFESKGFHRKRGRKPPYASNFAELTQALAAAGVGAQRRRFRAWRHIDLPAILKTNVRANGDWHWVVAVRHPEYGVEILDPGIDFACYQRPPMPGESLDFDFYVPAGFYLEICMGNGA